eukprot:TRINITY_DN13923_c0_g1_i1.p1 TRINITY_DN13923_c0_g1~~TRINITY_DN13923_c0_g1_i1.p1  ORF type:complete len:326 (-),score=68.96 TRINITY_DN13923_c0_g1_i1:26-1003(-)
MRDTMQFKRSGPKPKGGKPKKKAKSKKGGFDVLFGRSGAGGKGKSTLSNVANVFNQQWREARVVLCDGGQRLLYYVKSNHSQSNNIVGELFRTSTPVQSSSVNNQFNDEDDLQSADQPTTEKKRYVRVEDIGLISLAYIKATEPTLERYETLDPKTGKFHLFTKEETITFKPMSKQKGMKWIQGIREAIEKLPKHISTDVVISDHPVTYQDLKKQHFQLEELSLLGQSTLKTFVLRDGTLYCFKDEELEWTMFLWGATISDGGKKVAANSTKRMEIKLSSKFPHLKTVSLRASDDIITLSFYTSVLKHKLFLESFMELHQILPAT